VRARERERERERRERRGERGERERERSEARDERRESYHSKAREVGLHVGLGVHDVSLQVFLVRFGVKGFSQLLHENILHAE
jgi:hypothetical protein